MKQKNLTVMAIDNNLEVITTFIREQIEEFKCSDRIIMEIEIIIEEIFVNIAHYAYRPDVGKVEIQCLTKEAPLSIVVTFLDCGKAFDPLNQGEVDTSLKMLESREGGLGIHMIKGYVDDISYEYKDGKNILSFTKMLG